jgi:hypothetical protein
LSIVNGALAAVWQEGKKKRMNLLRDFDFLLRGGSVLESTLNLFWHTRGAFGVFRFGGVKVEHTTK